VERGGPGKVCTNARRSDAACGRAVGWRQLARDRKVLETPVVNLSSGREWTRAGEKPERSGAKRVTWQQGAGREPGQTGASILLGDGESSRRDRGGSTGWKA